MTTSAPSHPDPAGLKAGRPALYDARHQHLREMMAYFGVPAMLIVDPINIFYATGARNMMFFSMRVPARYLLILSEGPTILYEYSGCSHLAEECATISEIRRAEGLCYISSGGDSESAAMRFASEITATVKSFDATIDRLAVDRFPFAAIDALRGKGFSLTDADSVLQRTRMRKLAIEIPYMREAMRRVETAVGHLEADLEPGRTETEVWAQYHRGLIAKEGHYVGTRLFQSGEETFPYFKECSDRVMERGDMVCLDTDALGYEGYAADFSRSFICGDAKPTAVQKQLYTLAHEQLETNSAILQPGISYRELAETAWLIPAAYRDSHYSCIGHGLGLSGEYPNIPYKTEGQPYPLSGCIEPGMVICLESYIGSKEAGQGVKLENQYLIHDNGIEQMSTYPFHDKLL
tara:strand:- start:12285 stop:13502 length:1218 start_codon:yes stop_codon:yes gene_type:complete